MQETQQPKIGHYILGRLLGMGGFARVREAVHQFTGTKVAIKIINKKKMKTKKVSSKTKREIRFLRYFNHPNIIKLYQVLDNYNDIFMVMELAPKGDLYSLICEKKMDEKTGRIYFKQILSGVEYCHQNLIAHRDLKPENILVAENNLLKIADFGLSNLMKDGKFLNTSCGSPNYAPPEIIGGESYQGTLVDVWSCGIVLYAMLVGSLPFDEDIQMQLYRKIENGSYTIPSFLSPEAKDLIRRMLTVDPSKRITISQIKNHPWVRDIIPCYALVTSAFAMQPQPQVKINKQALTTVQGYNLDFHGHNTSDMIIRAIKKKEDLSFVIAYKLLTDDQQKKRDNRQTGEKERAKIFTQVHNTLRGQDEVPASWEYGRTFRTTARDLARRVIEVLRTLNSSYFIKSHDYKIKCTHIPRRLSSANSFGSVGNEDPQDNVFDDRLNDEKEFQEQLPKYTRKEITFTISIYEVEEGKKGQLPSHLLDLQLNRGHSFIFMEYVNVFLELVTRSFT